LREFRKMGFKLIVVSNQSGIARGLVQIENLHKIHARMQDIVAAEGLCFDAFYFSPHGPDSDHPTRKPNPGMVEQAIKEHDIDRSKSWMIGDRMLDVECGNRAGLKTILLGEKEHPKDFEYKEPTHVANELDLAADFIKSYIHT